MPAAAREAAPLEVAGGGAPAGRRLAGAGGIVVVGWAALTVALLFGGRAVVSSAVVVATDRTVTAWVVAHRTAGLDRAMRALTWTGSWLAALGLVALLVVLTVTHRVRGSTVAAVVVGWAGELGGVRLVKTVVQRPRPPEPLRLVAVHGWSFPSGHTATATVVFSTAAALTCLLVRSAAVRAAACAGAGSLIGLVAFSRVELGAHWLSDVVASVLWTTCWLLLVGLVAHRSWPERARPPAA